MRARRHLVDLAMIAALSAAFLGFLFALVAASRML